ncbi:MAG: hypothetical protein FRX48_02854 [Lasallia pustulata]|uniref:BSD domain-containing protein n=1 Tax=Lasallia pustulata TaxID=136370 RepID=A0A5M8PU18_9LECA|nr:MAG: hypothetical protein FRX48_02854 [Lasallia pustulata]
MDVAYDHIQEEVFSPDQDTVKTEGKKQEPGSLNTEFQEAYKSFSASPWGAKLGGFFGSVKKQGETYYEGARQEASAVGGEALKGFTDLKTTIANRTRSLSLNQSSSSTSTISPAIDETATESTPLETTGKERTDSEALQDSEGLIARFRSEAAKRLKDIEKAEDAADEALLKFGTNIRNFLRDAVTIAPPSEEKDKDGNDKILFESKDQDGKRVIHTTRFDAQLHAIHSLPDSFTKDPISPEYEKWKAELDVEKKTDEISKDLERYDELRRAMERLVPERVEYADFWTRYYFLRMVVETEEQRRRELLKGATNAPDEEIAWDEDSDSEPSTPQPSSRTTNPTETLTITQNSPSPPRYPPSPPTTTTTSSLTPSDPSTNTTDSSPKSLESRRSQDQHSQPDSDASYDLVSGATSRAPGSPKEKKEKGGVGGKERERDAVVEQSDEEDWE